MDLPIPLVLGFVMSVPFKGFELKGIIVLLKFVCEKIENAK